MTSSGSEEEELSLQYCIEYGVVAATGWYYRFSLLFSLITSLISVIHMLYFLLNRSRYNAFFHPNLRMLFYSMCLCCTMYDFMNIIMKTHHFAWSFLYQDPCDIFLPKALYIALNLPTIFVLVASQCMQLSIATERWIAILSADYQESSCRRLGPALITAAMMTTTCILLVMYYGENFNGPHLNARWFSIKDIVRTNTVLLFLVAMNLVGLVMTLALRYLGPKRKISMPLSSKFKAIENSIVSSYLFMISSCQFVALFFSHASILYLRIYESENPLVTAYKENLDLFNYYTLILPVLSVFYIRKVKSQRIKNIKENININTVGGAGWMNYSAILQKQWQ